MHAFLRDDVRRYEARHDRAAGGTSALSAYLRFGCLSACELERRAGAASAFTRQLAATGWMHNRARLVAASLLAKDLHVDWRRGEAHFMRLLLDGDVAQNNGNWQWVASVGVDPAPMQRRLYNPVLQQRAAKL